MVKNILPGGVECVFVRQPEQLGLGHAVLCAERVVGLVEKPKFADAPSDMACIRLSVLKLDVFEFCASSGQVWGTIQLEDGINNIVANVGLASLNLDRSGFDCGALHG